MKATKITPPSAEPVTPAEAKLHLGVETDDTANDALITSLIVVAREHVEDWTRRAIMTQTWDYYLDLFPSCDFIILPFGNLQSAPSATPAVPAPVITYRDVYGVPATMEVGVDYLTELNGEQHGRIVLPYGQVWPSGPFYPSNPIAIRFVCGWATAEDVPFKIKAAIKMIVSDLYEMRGEPTIGQTVVENKTVEALLASERLWGNF